MTSKRINDAYGFLCEKTKLKPEIAIVLGSGLGDFAQTVEADAILNYSDIPGFPVPTTPGHKGRLIIGKKYGRCLAVMQGRYHCYEGYAADETVIPLRALIKAGVKTLFITNASGGVNESFKAGDLAVITDHINFASLNPLTGGNLDDFGPRFPDMTYAYHPAYIELIMNISQKNKLEVKKGVYAYMKGPSFETPAEIRALRILGADMVGMSTVPEIITAAHAGVKCCAVSCVTNMAAGILDNPLTHEEVLNAGAMVKDKMQALIDSFIENV